MMLLPRAAHLECRDRRSYWLKCKQISENLDSLMVKDTEEKKYKGHCKNGSHNDQ